MNMKYYAGIDLGGTNIASCLIDGNYKLLAKSSVPTLGARGSDAVIEDMAAQVELIIEQSGLDARDVSYVGVGVPSPVDPATGNLIYANNLGWRNLPLQDIMSDRLGLPARLINDADAAALAEYAAGAAKGSGSVLMVTIGTGIGTGVIIDGKVFTGGRGYSIEAGHIVVEHGGEECSCGKRGCFEAYASANSLIRDTVRAMESHPDSLLYKLAGGRRENVSGKTVFEARRMGDTVAADVIDRYVGYLSCGISNLITVLMPETVVVGGGLIAQGETLLSPLRASIAESLYAAGIISPPGIALASLGPDAGAIGAAIAGAGWDFGGE